MSSIEGRYIRETDSETAELEVTVLADNRAKIVGSALWGKNRKYGPNIGELNFEAPVIDGHVVVYTKHSPSITENQDEYRLEIVFEENRTTAKERSAPGIFGMNVSFGGEYHRMSR